MQASWIIHEVSWPADVAAAVRAFADDAESAWLDSAAGDSGAERTGACGLICARPLAVLEQFDGANARLVVGGHIVAEDASAWALWRRVHRRVRQRTGMPWSVSPGWVGYVGFEMARQLERLPASRREDLGLPLFRMGLFDRGIVLEHKARRAFALTAQAVAETLELGQSACPEDADWIERWETGAKARPVHSPAATLVLADASRSEGRTPSDERGYATLAARVWPEMTRPAYERMVRRGLEYIAAGDIYQVNLAQRLWIEGVGDPLATYAAVRRSNPAPHAALLRWHDGAVASVSPELFLRLRGDEVLTRPIKGTRPRTGDPASDEPSRRELLASAKEAAELAMIVDLHRNDLGRVCRYGSVRVLHPRRVEAHPTVFHTVADIAGRLRPEHDALDLLAACFPAGSISGVPKIRALQIIDELEPAARGVYTGAIGFLGLDGQMTWNVAIRTLQMRGTAATLYVGGGIVADSDPAAEYEETLAKARGILRGIANGQPRIAGRQPSLADG